MADLKWWQKAVFYQIYPRSFADDNGDGVGDFQGIITRLNYLHNLGIDAIWLSPHYPSPFLDCGYDISDYTAVGPEYGSLADFRLFLEEAHRRNIHVVLDLVLNHTSNQHPWFEASKASLNNLKRDWYIWHEGQDGQPPNNWQSVFGGSAWELDPQTGQYYYHFFLKEQPDLNWHNPEVKQAMWEAVRFWLDLGVDGFRLDAISAIYEHPDLPNHLAPDIDDGLAQILQPPGDGQHEANFENFKLLFAHQIHQPGLHDLMQELRILVDSYPSDRVLVGEAEEIDFYGAGDNEVHLVFNFPLMRTSRLTPTHIRANQLERLAALPSGAWPCNTLGNHDLARVWSHFGDGQHNDALARLHLALLLTLWGTPFLYYGEEVGMTNLELTTLDQFRDTFVINLYQRLLKSKDVPPAQALQIAAHITRDRARTPMQWDDTANAGFSASTVQTWLPVNPNYATGVSVAVQESEPQSLLNFYKQMLRLRRATPALVAGSYRALHSQSETYLAFLRHDAATNQTCLVVLNFSSEAQTVTFDLDTYQLRQLFSSHPRANLAGPSNQVALAPFEVFVAELT